MRALVASLLVSVAAATLTPAPAAAIPADVIVVVDNSGSMLEPAAPGAAETKLDVARRVAARVIEAASVHHRVGLVAFAVHEEVVTGGEGPYTVRTEDPERCSRGGDLLVGLSQRDPEEALAWIDGVDTPASPELVAGGDSPLLRTTQVVFEYIRLRRWADPARACVNAMIVFVTDGEESCVPESEWRNGLRDLHERGLREDVRTLVLSFDPDGEASHLLAGVGREGEERLPYAPEQADALVDAIAALEGRFAPEACLAAGIPAEEIGGGVAPPTGGGTADAGATGSDAGEDGAGGSDDGGGGGCSVGAAGHRGGGMVPMALFVIALLGSRTWRLRGGAAIPCAAAMLIAAAALGCGGGGEGDDGDRRDVDGGTGEGGTAPGHGDGGFLDPPDPDAELERARTRIDALAEAAARIRAEHLAPILSAEARFAAVTGDPLEGCLALVQSLGYEPYRGEQRGPDACFAAGSCNGWDRARLLHACLESHGVAAEVRECGVSDETRAALRARALVPAAPVDLAPALAAVEAMTASIASDDPELVAAATSAAEEIATAGDAQLGEAIQGTVDAIRPHLGALGVDATAAESATDLRISNNLLAHFVVVAGDRVLEPTLDALPLGCAPPGVVDATEHRVQTTVRIEGYWVHPDFTLRRTPWTPLGEVVLDPAAHDGEWVTVRIADASASATDGAPLPEPSTTGCLRATFDVGGSVTPGEPFWIAAPDAAACPTTSPVEVVPGRHLAGLRIVLETRFAWGSPYVVERVLVDRYGYAHQLVRANETGPMYPDARMRELLAMRVDFPIVSGVPSDAKLLDVWLEQLIDGAPLRVAAVANELGVPLTEMPAYPRPTAPWTVLAALARRAPGIVPDDAMLVVERPWLLPLVTRRAFVAVEGGLALGALWILDLADVPVLVGGGEPNARLEAQLALGALLTEAERIAVGGQAFTGEVVNAAGMLRDPEAAPWVVWGSAEWDAQRYPESVREAAERLRFGFEGYGLLATDGAVSFGGGDYIAWWRVDPDTGFLIGDVRLEGTFYAGAGSSLPDFVLNMLGAYYSPVAYLAEVDKCLYTAASAALSGTEYNVRCCLVVATGKFYFGSALHVYTNGLFSTASSLLAGRGVLQMSGKTIERVLEAEFNLIRSIPLMDSCA